MTKLVITGATLKCSMGTATSSLTVLPDKKTDCDNQALASVQDHKPSINIAPFGMCRSMANPQVAAATAAAQGTLTPQPCVPMTTSPWAPGSASVSVSNISVLTAASKCNCQWAGVIEITSPAQEDAETA